MASATERTVLGNFDGVTYTSSGVTSRFFKKSRGFFVDTEGPDGRIHQYRIAYTFGWYPLQQYLVECPRGRLQALTIAWDSKLHRWFDLYPDKRLTPQGPLFWTNGLHNWNNMCADCHSTDLRKNYDSRTDSYATRWSAINVSCEACHGPGSIHVAVERSMILRWFAGYSYGLDIRLRGRKSSTILNTCAPCHSRREIIASGYLPGDRFMDYYRPELLRAGIYYADGGILGEDYEYGSFVQSKMYKHGVRCTDCHDPHSAKLYAQGNALCVRCHQAARFNTPRHYFHKAGSPGSLCIGCHMPTRTYMIVDVRRDHYFRMPRPDLSIKLGIPNACNNCHKDKSPEWAAAAVAKWYGSMSVHRPGYARLFAMARTHEAPAETGLVRLSSDRTRSFMVRATAVLLLRGYSDQSSTDAIRQALSDPNPLVRATAVAELYSRGSSARIATLTPILQDRVRAVREAAARSLASCAREMPRPDRVAFDAALKEYIDGQEAEADAPGAHLNLGTLYEDLGQPRRAEHEYRVALRLDATFVPARMNLALLLDQLGNDAEAEQLLKEVVAADPEMGRAHYALGLLLAQKAAHKPDIMEKATAELLAAAQLMPKTARVHYNAGLALQRAGRLIDAEEQLRIASNLDSNSSDALFALIMCYVQQRDWSNAYKCADELRLRHPTLPAAQSLFQFIHRKMGH